MLIFCYVQTTDSQFAHSIFKIECIYLKAGIIGGDLI